MRTAVPFAPKVPEQTSPGQARDERRPGELASTKSARPIGARVTVRSFMPDCSRLSRSSSCVLCLSMKLSNNMALLAPPWGAQPTCCRFSPGRRFPQSGTCPGLVCLGTFGAALSGYLAVARGAQGQTPDGKREPTVSSQKLCLTIGLSGEGVARALSDI